MTTFLLEYRNILIFIICSFVLYVILLVAVYILSFTSKVDLEKSSAYECGFQPFSETSYPFEVQFAVIAIMFLLFDIEVLYLFPLVQFLYFFSKISLKGLNFLPKTKNVSNLFLFLNLSDNNLSSNFLFFLEFFCNFVFLIILIFFIYCILYKWRKIPYSFWSFLNFLGNIFIIYVMLNIIIKVLEGIPDPFYVDNLSMSSAIKYIFFIVFSIFSLSIFFINKKTPSLLLQKLIEKSSFPYLKEEMRIFFSTWEDTIFGSLFEKLLSKIAFNRKKSFIIFNIHFFFFYLIPLIQSLLFFNFAFFQGDLRYNLYLIPLSFLSWCFKNFWYYFIYFYEQNCFAVREKLIVTYEDQNLFNKNDIFVTIELHKLKFTLKLTEDTIYNKEQLLEEYKHYYIMLGLVEVRLFYYKKLTKYFSYIILLLRFCSWCFICFELFIIKNYYLSMTLPVNIPLRLLSKTPLMRNYATESFFIKKAHQKNLENISKGAYKGGHPVTTDTNKTNLQKEVPFYHQPTHGSGGASTNKSLPLSSMEDLEGFPKQQNAVYPKTKFSFPEKWLDKVLPKSKSFYEKPEVKENDKKNDDNYTSHEKD